MGEFLASNLSTGTKHLFKGNYSIGAAAMEQLDFNLLFRWFVSLSIDDLVWGCHRVLQKPVSAARWRRCP
jgi:hypothetical protein